MIESWSRGGFEVSTDPARLDVPALHALLKDSYWAKERPLSTVQAMIRGSCCFGAYEGGRQAGFARAVTDYATFAYVADVIVAPSARGRGLGKMLVECLLASKALAPVRTFTLKTSDAHGLYAAFGFKADDPAKSMILKR